MAKLIPGNLKEIESHDSSRSSRSIRFQALSCGSSSPGRAGEVCGLQWDDLGLDRGEARDAAPGGAPSNPAGALRSKTRTLDTLASATLSRNALLLYVQQQGGWRSASGDLALIL